MSSLYTLKEVGHFKVKFSLSSQWQRLVAQESYDELYLLAQNEIMPGGELACKLEHLCQLTDIKTPQWELMLAKRVGPQSEEDEGIWHDDGGRALAFSLSLNLRPENIQGGLLKLRKKRGQGEILSLATPAWGEAWVFATGQMGWEHRISRVTYGNRLVLVGWMS